MGSHEVAQRDVAGEITPTEDGADQPQPPRVLLAERDAHRDGFVLSQEPVRRVVAVAPDPDLTRRGGAEVAHPVGIGSPPEQITTSPES